MRDWLEAMCVYFTRGRRALHARAPCYCVGGALLGGTGKTPVAIELARALAARGAKVALVGHAYRARPGRARVARPDDPLEEVGDEALVCARALDGVAKVVVASTRQAAIDHAESFADALVLDGVLQLERRATLSILTAAGTKPTPRLAELADVAFAPRVEMRAPFQHLKRARVGLITCLARPHRIRAALEAHDVFPVVHHTCRNHGPATRAEDARVDVWVATEKCALHLGRPVTLLRARAELPEAVLDRLEPSPYPETSSRKRHDAAQFAASSKVTARHD